LEGGEYGVRVPFRYCSLFLPDDFLFRVRIGTKPHCRLHRPQGVLRGRAIFQGARGVLRGCRPQTGVGVKAGTVEARRGTGEKPQFFAVGENKTCLRVIMPARAEKKPSMPTRNRKNRGTATHQHQRRASKKKKNIVPQKGSKTHQSTTPPVWAENPRVNSNWLQTGLRVKKPNFPLHQKDRSVVSEKQGWIQVGGVPMQANALSNCTKRVFREAHKDLKDCLAKGVAAQC